MNEAWPKEGFENCAAFGTPPLILWSSKGLKPGLVHQEAPEHIPTFALALLVLVPKPAQLAGVEKALPAQPGLGQVLLRPLPQRSSQPAVHRSAEAHFGAVRQL